MINRFIRGIIVLVVGWLIKYTTHMKILSVFSNGVLPCKSALYSDRTLEIMFFVWDPVGIMESRDNNLHYINIICF